MWIGDKKQTETAQKAISVCKDCASSLVYRDIVIERVSWIAGIMVIVTGQGQGVGMARRDTGRHLHPGIILVARSGQNGGSPASSVILEGRRGPVIPYCIGAVHQVPEAQFAGATGRGKGLCERAGIGG